MQFEDPTDELQLLREGVDVERAIASGWLPELAAKVCSALRLPDRSFTVCGLSCLSWL